MKRKRIDLPVILERNNLVRAVYQAARGKRQRPEVVDFVTNLDTRLDALTTRVLDGTVQLGRHRTFHIRDPKPRVIHAPVFEERVLHHAIMALVGPVVDRALVDDTFACRLGGGTRGAVERCQRHVRRFAWYAKMDVRHYFASIDHEILLRRLERLIKSQETIGLIRRIVSSHEDAPGKGLPIGALTSQYFANLYLGALDRYLLETCHVAGMVRYMDDVVLWGHSRTQVVDAEAAAGAFIRQALALEPKAEPVINRSGSGVTLCGFRVFPGTVRLTPRRKRRYLESRRHWEGAWRRGDISERQLQRGYAAAHAITLPADASRWRRAATSAEGRFEDEV